MEDHGIVSAREKLESVIGNYHDFLGDEAGNLCRQHGIDPAKKLQVDLASIAEEDRLLKIGIVGRTNSGKSSLLNALLFEGQSILPKAATSMTAALTTLSYGEKLAAEVEFFTDADFKDIEAKYKEYKQERERLYRTYLDETKRVKRPAAGQSHYNCPCANRFAKYLWSHPALSRLVCMPALVVLSCWSRLSAMWRITAIFSGPCPRRMRD